ncbi:PAS domain S-box protein [Alkalihalobacillus macyae]|uniref:PAS domain S-box protein n=1 Tax=Guptibacillus hwajinpoensis TaxID=208199 RepID=UPI00273CA8BF|nr:PAS domain S-box protein [Alkalihalobacillus macyae]MDP4552076.1 PAS domain S-box protein [Alkalihalobacillus macyae]
MEELAVAVSKTGRLKFVSYLIQKTLGPEHKLFKSPSVFHLVHPDDIPKIELALIKTIEAKECHTIKFRYKRRSGEWIIITASAVPLMNGNEIDEPLVLVNQFKTADGKCLISGKYISIDHLKSKCNLLFEKNPDAMFSLDLEGRFTSVNKACSQISGYSKEELESLRLFDLLSKPLREAAIEKFNEIIQDSDDQVTSVIQIFHKQGKAIDLKVTCIPIIEEERISGVYGIAKDITERRYLKNELLKAKENFRMLLNTFHSGIFISEYNPNGPPCHFIEVNKMACEILGYTKDELLQMSYINLHPPDLHQILYKHVKRFRKNESISFKSVHITKHGEKLPVEITTQLLTLNHNKVIVSIVDYQSMRMKYLYNEEQYPKDPGKNLRLLMAEMDINTTELATITNLTQATISNLRTGKVKKPNIETARKISAALSEKVSTIWPSLDY